MCQAHHMPSRRRRQPVCVGIRKALVPLRRLIDTAGKEMLEAIYQQIRAAFYAMEKEKGLQLFGVRIEAATMAAMEEVVRRSQSMMNLCAANQSSTTDYGYLSDGGLAQNSRPTARQERKKGIPWTELVHRTFLAGLEKLGKGDWREISRLCDHMNSNINKDLLEALNQLEERLKDNIKRLSSFDKYKQEVLLGHLDWSPMYKVLRFLHKNITNFEENDFQVLARVAFFCMSQMVPSRQVSLLQLGTCL